MPYKAGNWNALSHEHYFVTHLLFRYLFLGIKVSCFSTVYLSHFI